MQCFPIFRIIAALYIFGAQQFLCEVVKVMETVTQAYFPFWTQIPKAFSHWS